MLIAKTLILQPVMGDYRGNYITKECITKKSNKKYHYAWFLDSQSDI